MPKSKLRWSITLLSVLLLLTLVPPVFSQEIGDPIHWEHCTPGVDRMPDLHGNTLYYAKEYDIYYSTWDDATGTWSEPAAVPGPINTGANEINPCVIKDGKVLYFARYDPITDYDFYRSEWDDAKGEWGEPVLIEELSTDAQEWAIWVDEDETVAYVTTKGTYGDAASIGERDIWKSVRKDGVWSTPVNIGAPINTPGSEWSVFVDSCGRIYSDGKREDSLGGYDIYVSENDSAEPINVGAPINSSADEREIAINDKFIFFSATKREGGVGNFDMWYIIKSTDK